MSNWPTFYDPQRIGTLFYPDMNGIAAAAAAANLAPAAADQRQVHLVIIDMQIDFCHLPGNLNVPGSVGDIQRLIEFIYRHAGQISHITCSLDSHLPRQIFSPTWWADGEGRHPAPFTIITADDIAAGKWRPLVDPERSIRYVQQLEQQARKQLCIWPYHTLIGSIGTALDPELWSAVFWHSLARQTQPTWLVKGSIPETEHYSIIQPELPVAGQPMGEKNELFLQSLAAADMVIIAGEAASHCVLESVADIVEHFAQTPEKLASLYLLQDCTSPVLHPEIDFPALTQTRFHELADKGINLVNSTDRFL
ncbi:MAG: hypothetical protein KJ063_04005 [Anaerolineae bacterium]|nr:hypothetical protein [Anaerolineae bacterium]